MVTMGDVALCSERSEDLLYRLFGKNAELLIDHAWGWGADDHRGDHGVSAEHEQHQLRAGAALPLRGGEGAARHPQR